MKLIFKKAILTSIITIAILVPLIGFGFKAYKNSESNLVIQNNLGTDSLLSARGGNCGNCYLITDGDLDYWYYDSAHQVTGSSWDTAYEISNLSLNETCRYFQFYYTSRYLIIRDCVFENLNAKNAYIDPLFIMYHCDNVKFINCTFIECDICIQLDNSQNTIIESCKFESSGYSIQITGSCSSNNNIRNNEFHNCYHAIEFYRYASNTTIYLNNFTGNIANSYSYNSGVNHWHNGTLGNYYGNYAEVYPNATYEFTSDALDELNRNIALTQIIYGIGNQPVSNDLYPIFDFDYEDEISVLSPIEGQEFNALDSISIQFNPMFIKNANLTVSDEFNNEDIISAVPGENSISTAWNNMEDGEIIIQLSCLNVFSEIISSQIQVHKNTMKPEFSLSYSMYCGLNSPEIILYPEDSNNPVVTAKLNISVIAVDAISYNSNFIASIPTMVWISLPDGEFSIEIIAENHLGISSNQTISIIKDTIKPVIYFDSSEDKITIDDQNLQNSSITVFNLETQDRIEYTDTINFDLSSLSGHYLILAEAYDKAGNCENFHYIIDNAEDPSVSNSVELSDYLLMGVSLLCITLIISNSVIRRKMKKKVADRQKIKGGL